MNRYSVIKEKNSREIVLLRGSGCVYGKCAFCDYHLDGGKNLTDNFNVNKFALDKVTGKYGRLEVINSGSVFELDRKTLGLVKKVCKNKKIDTIHFEAHYLYKNKIAALKNEFKDFKLKMKLGLETFDFDFREDVLKKGIKEKNPEIIAEEFDEANFLFGIKGQTVNSMKNDVELGLKYFERICVNIMCGNTTNIEPDDEVVSAFLHMLYPRYKNNGRVDILIKNTDFGVGD